MQGDIVNVRQAVAACGYDQCGSQLIAAMIGDAIPRGIELIHAFADLQKHRVIGTRGMVEAGRCGRL
jgi:hypothetical protein